MSEYLLHIAVLICIFSILSISYNLIMGFARLFSLSHAALFGVGAYASALFSINIGTEALPLLAVSAGVAAVIAALIAVPALRVRSYYLAVLSMGFQMVATGLMVNLLNVTGGESGMGGIPKFTVTGHSISSKAAFLLFGATLAVFLFAAATRLVTSPFGRVVKAIREDEKAAQALGKNVVYFKVAIFVFSGAMAGIAGSLYAHYVTFINPTSFTFVESVFIISMVVVGGTANLWGSVLGAVILVTVPEMTRFIDGVSQAVVGPLRVILYGALLILVVRFRPKGLLPEYMGLRRMRDRSLLLTEKAVAGSAGEPIARGRFSSDAADDERPPSQSGDVILDARNLAKSFGGLRAVQDLSIRISRGQITSLIGPNGAGKTTFFNLITGEIPPDSGEVVYNGRNLIGLPPHRIMRMGLSRTFQDVRLFPQMTVLDTVLVARPGQSGENILRAFGPLAHEMKSNTEAALRILAFVGLTEKRDEMAENLSYAEQKLLSIARILATESELLLLDEPTSGLDPLSITVILDLVKSLPRLGRTVCIVEHNLDVIRELSDYVYFLAEGHVIKSGAPHEIFSDPHLAEIYFGGGSVALRGEVAACA